MPGDPSPPETGQRQAEKPVQNISNSEDDTIGAGWHKDSEKQVGDEHEDDEVGRAATRRLNIQAIPGVHLDEEYEEGYESREGTDIDDTGREVEEREGGGGGGRGGLGGVLDRVVSRVSTKSSCHPGPPPNGGVKAWTAGTYAPVVLPYKVDDVEDVQVLTLCFRAVAASHLVVMNTWYVMPSCFRQRKCNKN